MGRGVRGAQRSWQLSRFCFLAEWCRTIEFEAFRTRYGLRSFTFLQFADEDVAELHFAVTNQTDWTGDGNFGVLPLGDDAFVAAKYHAVPFEVDDGTVPSGRLPQKRGGRVGP